MSNQTPAQFAYLTLIIRYYQPHSHPRVASHSEPCAASAAAADGYNSDDERASAQQHPGATYQVSSLSIHKNNRNYLAYACRVSLNLSMLFGGRKAGRW